MIVLRISGLRPGGQWGVVDTLTDVYSRTETHKGLRADVDTFIRNQAADKLQEWIRNSTDQEGYFHNWDFRIMEQTRTGWVPFT